MNFSPSKLLDPRRDRFDRMGAARRRGRVEASHAGEPLEVAPGREDQPRLAALLALQHVRRASPSRRRRIRPRSRCGCQSPGGRLGDEEQGVEPPRRVELGHPARERGQRVEVEPEPGVVEQLGERPVGDQRALQLERQVSAAASGRRPTGTAVSSIVSRIAATRAARRSRARRAKLRGRPRRSGRRGRPARRRQTPCPRRARPSAARAVRPRARAPRPESRRGSARRSSPRLGGAGQRKAAPEALTFLCMLVGLHAADVRPASVGLACRRPPRLSLASWFCCLPSAAASRIGGVALAASSQVVERRSPAGSASALLQLRPGCCRRKRQERARRLRQGKKASFFIDFHVPQIRPGSKAGAISAAQSLRIQRAKIPILGGRATGYVGRVLGGIGISDPGGSTPAPPPPAALAEIRAVADGGEIGSTSAIKTRLPIGMRPP